MYNSILLSVSLSTDSLSAGALSILSSQLNRLLDSAYRNCTSHPMKGLEK